jgi:hypothetical protein
METADPNGFRHPLQLPHAVQGLLGDIGIAPTDLCRRLLLRASQMSLRKLEARGELSCTGVFFSTLVLLNALDEYAGEKGRAPIEEKDRHDLANLERAFGKIRADAVKWSALVDRAREYYGAKRGTEIDGDITSVRPTLWRKRCELLTGDRTRH